MTRERFGELLYLAATGDDEALRDLRREVEEGAFDPETGSSSFCLADGATVDVHVRRIPRVTNQARPGAGVHFPHARSRSPAGPLSKELR